jgi:hypothetical protein
MNARTLLFPVVVLCALAGGLLFAAAPVLAANGHALTNSFGSETSTVPDSEPLSKPTGVAWSAKTSEIYVIDTGHDRIARFSSNGTPEGEFESPAGGFSAPNAIAVDNDPGSLSYGDVYVSDAGHNVIDKFGPTGVYLNQLTGTCAAPGVCPGSVIPFGELRGVAVDLSGNLWVESQFGPMDEFNDASVNEFVSSEAAEFEVGPGFAVDSKDNIYFVYGFFHNVFRSAPGVGFEFFAGLEGCGCVRGLAVDQTAGPALDGVYVDQGTSVAQYPPDPPAEEPPIEPEVFGSGALGEGSGIAVSATGTVYVADTTANDVDVFEEGPKPETPTTEAPEKVTGTTATLKGVLSPKNKGEAGTYEFLYKQSAGECELTQVESKTREKELKEVQEEIRLNPFPSKEFKTKEIKTQAQGRTPEPAGVYSGPLAEAKSAEPTGLIAKTKYTVCLAAKDKYGQESGAPVTFETRSSVPVVEKESSAVTKVNARLQSRATLSASVNPEREASTCVFQYGKGEAYEHETSCVPSAGGEPGKLGEGFIAVPVTAALTGLQPDVVYRYRVLATNATGSQSGEAKTFTSEVIAPTQVQTAPVTGVTPTTVVFGGQVNPGGGATYYIEYGSPTCSLNGVPNFAWWLCATRTAEAGPIGGDSVQTVAPIEVTGLTPGTTYRYWIVARNVNGSERGEEATFTTPTVGTPALGGVTATPPVSAVLPAPKPAATKPPPPKRRSAAQERAKKLSKALERCRKLRPKAKRKACEAQAHKRYGPKTKSKPKSSKRGH